MFTLPFKLFKRQTRTIPVEQSQLMWKKMDTPQEDFPPVAVFQPVLTAPQPIILQRANTPPVAPLRTYEETYMVEGPSGLALALQGMLRYHTDYNRIPSHILLSEARYREFQAREKPAHSLDGVSIQSADIADNEVTCFIQKEEEK